MSRLAEVFKQDNGALSVYITAGHPSLDASEANIRAAIAAGADFIEVGIPFSDPVADGPIIEEAAAVAIRNGTTVQQVLAMVQRVRADAPDVGLVCMTYANIAFQMGWDGFASALAQHGFDGAIIPDAPLEEAKPLRDALGAHRVDWIPLVTPTTPPERMASIAETATGFLYVVGNVGITGQDDPGPLVESVVARARAAGAKVPLVVGFGLRTAEDVARVWAAGADGAIVGSALVQQITDGADEAAVESFVRALRPEPKG